MRYADLKIGTKLGSAFALLLVVTLALGGLALLQMDRMHQAMQSMGANALPSVAEAGNIRSQWNRFRRLESHLLPAQTPQNAQALLQVADTVLASIVQSEKNYEALSHTSEEQQLMHTYQQHRQAYMQAHQQFVAAAQNLHRTGSGAQLVDRAGSTMNDVVAAIRRVSDLVGEISAASTQQNAALVEESAAAAESLKRKSWCRRLHTSKPA